MATIIVKNTEQQVDACLLISSRSKFPFTIKVTDGLPRSLKQNRLYHKWMGELAEQGDLTAEEYTAHCKLYIGMGLLMAEDLQYKEYIERMLKGRFHTIEEKLEIMKEPYGLPVSSQMNTKQFTMYLDAIHKKFTAQGFHLTEPEQ